MLLSPDQIYFLVSLIASVPSSGVYRSLPSHIKFEWMKHMLGVVWSFCIYTFVFGSSSFFVGLVPVVFVWLSGLLLNKLDDDSKKRKWLCVGVWVGCMGYLSVYHINRMMKYWLLQIIDSTTTQMMITIKLTQFITEVYYHKYDSTHSIDKKQDNGYPTLIEWLGFIYFIPSVLAGPVLSFDEYKNFVKYCESYNPRKLDKNVIAQFRVLIIKACGLFVLSVIGVGWFSTLYFTTQSFYEMSFVSKLFILYITMFFMRCKYYFIWTISEMAYISSGSSTFVQYRGRNVDILDVELAGNVYTLTNGWNKKTNVWLKDCVYKPLLKEGHSKIVCIISTNLISSFWHGFYPGYYITFILGGASTFLGQYWRRNVSSVVRGTGNRFLIKMYENAKVVVVALLMAFVSAPFDLCDISRIVTAYNALYWYGAGLIIVGWGVVIMVPRFLKRHQILIKDKNE